MGRRVREVVGTGQLWLSVRAGGQPQGLPPDWTGHGRALSEQRTSKPARPHRQLAVLAAHCSPLSRLAHQLPRLPPHLQLPHRGWRHGRQVGLAVTRHGPAGLAFHNGLWHTPQPHHVRPGLYCMPPQPVQAKGSRAQGDTPGCLPSTALLPPHSLAPLLPLSRSLARNQFSNQAERWPGLWDIPVWELSALGGAYDMDYGEGG